LGLGVGGGGGGGNKERGKKNDGINTGCISELGIGQHVKFGSVKYCFVLCSNLRIVFLNWTDAGF